jgi:hypothetical protein
VLCDSLPTTDVSDGFSAAASGQAHAIVFHLAFEDLRLLFRIEECELNVGTA